VCSFLFGGSVFQKIQDAVNIIQKQVDLVPKVGLILGSGLGFFADLFEEAYSIPYENIPHFPKSTIVGHEGSLVFGKLKGQPCVCMKGRVHYYEGYSMQNIIFPVYVMKALGVESLVVTNAAGGVNPDFSVGDLMVIEDHINFMGDHPLRGPNLEEFGPRFPDMSYAYTPDLCTQWHTIATEHGLTLKQGVYIAMSGPSYETPAEIRMVGKMGADAVGMSTVPEVITASHCGLKVAGLSVITNLAAGLSKNALNHAEVKEASERVRVNIIPLLQDMIARL
jgi:purine-nucleoside phosphorylase